MADSSAARESSTNAVLAATRMVLWDAVKHLTDESRDLLYDAIDGIISDFRIRWGSEPLDDFRMNFLDELERIKFRLAQRQQFRGSHDEPGPKQAEFVCIKCSVFATGHGSSLSCPSCGTSEWLEMWRI